VPALSAEALRSATQQLGAPTGPRLARIAAANAAVSAVGVPVGLLMPYHCWVSPGFCSGEYQAPRGISATGFYTVAPG
jgi:hypothetical protein